MQHQCNPVVLVVDDDPVFCAIMHEFLTSDGYKVHLAYDVHQALRRKIRSAPAWSNIPTIIVSAKAMPEDRSQALAAGANAFVSKPFSIKQFRREITKYLPAHSG
ncbi:MAG: response regulator [Anaerolineales bacterium]